jgi:hypothetical protein
VKIYDADLKKLRGSEVTDADGRFGFLVSPGRFFLYVTRVGFKDYQSEVINVSSSDAALNLEISLASQDREVKRPIILKILIALKNVLDAISPWLLLLGTLMSVVAAVILPTALNFGIAGFYLIIDALKIILASFSLKSFGRVIDKTTGRPVELAVVRIFDVKRSLLLNTRATDERGRFKFLVTPGNYYLTCAKQGYRSFTSAPAAVQRAEAITWDIILEPER